MSVAVYINNSNSANALVSWGIRFAQADSTALLIVVPRRQKQDPAKFDPLELQERDQNELFNSVFTAIEKHSPERYVLEEKIAVGYSDLDRVMIETRELVATKPEDAFVQNVATMDIKTLILPVADKFETSSTEAGWAQQLYETAPCETIMVRGAPPRGALNTLVVADRDMGADTALHRAAALAHSKSTFLPEEVKTSQYDQQDNLTSDQQTGGSVATGDKQLTETPGKVRFLFVRPDDDEVAYQVAELHTRKILAKAGSKCKGIQPEIVLSENLMEAVNHRDIESVDLILLGTRHLKLIRSLFRHKFSNHGATKNVAPQSVGAIRPAIPLGNRLSRNAQVLVRRTVPQLDKEARVSLVDRLQEGSSFNFDFASLISLSTIIAALGLLDNSAAVVIGAMLVAPLMTPLVGMGFAMVQVNERLMRKAFKAVVMGFAVAFGIGATLGLLVNGLTNLEVTPEMAGRDLPSLIDLFVALFSGVAGAYAMSRANLISALPGVAIAAALVPPIATAGMALTMGDLVLGSGALLLFLTNIVAIVLGTAVTFWAVGINTRMVKNADGSNQRPPRMWPRYWLAALVILSFLLAIGMEIFHPLHVVPEKTNPASVITNDQ